MSPLFNKTQQLNNMHNNRVSKKIKKIVQKETICVQILKQKKNWHILRIAVDK